MQRIWRRGLRSRLLPAVPAATRRAPRVPLGMALALGWLAAAPLQGQQRPDPGAIAKMSEAAFEHWWPKYQRLMRTLIENQHVEPGRLKVPPPEPEDLRSEIHIGQGFSNPYLPGYTFYGVHTQGSVFEGLFLMDPAGKVSVLVNHDDPEDRRPFLEDAYVDHMNRILDHADVKVDSPQEAASLARFFLSTFFNFTVHPEDATDPKVQDELQRVRVLSSFREIPQGRRILRFGSKQAFLVFEPVPPEARETIRPPVVVEREPEVFLVRLFTWHPVRGEVKSWEILLDQDHFEFFRDQTVSRWKAYRFEGLN